MIRLILFIYLTEFYCKTSLLKAKAIAARLKNYIQKHPELIIIDPFENVHNLRNRYTSYEMIRKELQYDG